MTSKTHQFKNAMRVYAAELICSTEVSGFQTFKLVSLELSAKFASLVLVCEEVWGKLRIQGEGRAQEGIPGSEPPCVYTLKC